ncbi:hypothetical protein H9W95_12930 [Flavobacterium lindanitolerans]|nr:hypothetical protein [Flavobacterium lindanitolerans]
MNTKIKLAVLAVCSGTFYIQAQNTVVGTGTLGTGNVAPPSTQNTVVGSLIGGAGNTGGSNSFFWLSGRNDQYRWW